MRTSVVILSYRPGDWLAGAVDSVVDQAGEVVVVDNGSPGAVASTVARRGGARVVRSERNLGFAGGVNLGVAATTGDVVALLNDDATAAPGWLAASCQVLSDPTVAAVGPKVLLARAYREVVLADEEHRAPGDPRPLGRQLRSVTVDGLEVLDQLLGHVHGLERSAGDRWRWTAGRRPWYVPLPAGPDSPVGSGPGATTAAPSTGTGTGFGVALNATAPPRPCTSPDAEILVNGHPAPPGPTCRLVNSAGVYLRRDGYAGDLGLGVPDDGRLDERRDRFALSGTAVAFRADTWARLGGLAAVYFAYYEDVDWCWRANLAGLRLVYDPTSTVDHQRSATSGGGAAVRVMAERNRTLSMVRNGPLPPVAEALRARWTEGPDGGVRREVARLFPWAVATRLAGAVQRAGQDHLGREVSRQSASPTPTSVGRARARTQVWERWAGTDNTWDDAPARLG